MAEEQEKKYYIYLPKQLTTQKGNVITITDPDQKEKVINMVETIDIVLNNFRKDITLMDSIRAHEYYQAVKSMNEDDEKVEVDKEIYNWLFDLVDDMFLILFGINALHVKAQLFQDENEEEIINKAKNKQKTGN